MILLCGIPSETPLQMVARELQELGAEFRFFNQRQVAECRIEWEVADGEIDGVLQLGDEALRLADVRGAYLRLMDQRFLPELEGLPGGHPATSHAAAVHEALFRWTEVAPGRFVNRAEPQGSNGSKPYQAQLLARHGLKPPPTLITNDPEAVIAFRNQHGRIVYKSMSAVRSIVKELGPEELDRLERIRWCPVQFQALIRGVDIRVHVVGQQAIATAIVSNQVDYRYAKRQGGETELRAFELEPDVAEKCVALTGALGLAFAGIDLKRTADGEYYCFEANPSPAFSYFEANTGQRIARAVARHLAEKD